MYWNFLLYTDSDDVNAGQEKKGTDHRGVCVCVCAWVCVCVCACMCVGVYLAL